MLGLTIHNFLSAATGIAVAFALFRGFARREMKTIGNFWADMTRATLYLLLPICVVYAVFLIASGVPQTLAGRSAERRVRKEGVSRCRSLCSPNMQTTK